MSVVASVATRRGFSENFLILYGLLSVLYCTIMFLRFSSWLTVSQILGVWTLWRSILFRLNLVRLFFSFLLLPIALSTDSNSGVWNSGRLGVYSEGRTEARLDTFLDTLDYLAVFAPGLHCSSISGFSKASSKMFIWVHLDSLDDLLFDWLSSSFFPPNSPEDCEAVWAKAYYFRLACLLLGKCYIIWSSSFIFSLTNS